MWQYFKIDITTNLLVNYSIATFCIDVCLSFSNSICFQTNPISTLLLHR